MTGEQVTLGLCAAQFTAVSQNKPTDQKTLPVAAGYGQDALAIPKSPERTRGAPTCQGPELSCHKSRPKPSQRSEVRATLLKLSNSHS